MNSNVLIQRICLIAIILAAAAAAPRTSRSTVPSWYLPCGEDLELEISSSEDSENELTRISLETLTLQHKLTMDEYLNSGYEEDFYENVRIGVHDHQYIPSWVPGQEDVDLVRKLANTNPRTVSALTRLIESFVSDVFQDLERVAVVERSGQQEYS